VSFGSPDSACRDKNLSVYLPVLVRDFDQTRFRGGIVDKVMKIGSSNGREVKEERPAQEKQFMART
jgi:hypothetical protein